jgi:hypothetical protein
MAFPSPNLTILSDEPIASASGGRNAMRESASIRVWRLSLLAGLALALGCGTTRMTDTQRTATEQLLVSHAVDTAVSQLDFSGLAGKTVYFDPQYLDGTVDRGYLVSSLRQHLLASGCLLQEDRTKATYVVEARSGGLGTDRHSLLIGIPQMTVPTFVPGQPSQIPEIPLAKKNDQHGLAKVAVFAYNRQTGEAVWQSGVVQAASTARDTWVMGAGPFQRGSIRRRTVFSGLPLVLPLPGLREREADDSGPGPAVVPVTQAAYWPEHGITNAVLDERAAASKLLGSAASGGRAASGAQAGEPKVFTTPPPAPNAGGHAETEPAKVISTGSGYRPDR